MSILLLIGRILWVAVFLGSAMGHLSQRRAMAGYAASKRIPAPEFTVVATGVFLAVSSAMVAFGVYADLAFLLQAAYLAATALLMHDFWRAGDPQGRMMEMTQFTKNLSLAGAALMLFVFFGLGQGAGIDFTITDSLFDLSL